MQKTTWQLETNCSPTPPVYSSQALNTHKSTLRCLQKALKQFGGPFSFFTSVMPVGTTARRSISFVFHTQMSPCSTQSKADRQPETYQSAETRQLFLAKALKHLSKQCDHLQGQVMLKRTMGPAGRSFGMVWKNLMYTIQSPTSSACRN